jgi:prepilin-type N-terminal cleavage/methylation domain-containing protein
MLPGRRPRGFTLIEAMIVVAIVGVLAVLASVGYTKWVRSSFGAEGQDMIANIRTQEEAYLGENGAYVNVSLGLGPPNDYPNGNPAASKTAWGAPCSTCVGPNSWQTLGVTSNAPVVFGYSVIAGDGVNVLPGALVTNKWGPPTVNGATIGLTGMQNGSPWFFAEADANVTGDGTHYMHVYGMSGTNRIYVDGEGN